MNVAGAIPAAVTSFPIPSQAFQNCYVSIPKPFLYSDQSPFGPFCVNFTTQAGVSTSYMTPFLGSKISITTDVDAVVFFGPSVITPQLFIPTGMIPLTFVGSWRYRI